MGATSLTELVERVNRAYNDGDVEAALELFEPGAVLVTEPGQPVTGERLRESIAGFLAQRPTIVITIRHVYESGDLALLITDHTTGSVTGTATDVTRRGADGLWRYVIDNPAGTGT